jgi:hypothetical protein
MAAFSPTEAAFEGFRLTREQPRVVAVWAMVFALFSLVSAWLMISTIGPQFPALQAASQNPAGLAEADAVKILPFYALVLPVVLVFWSVLICAVYRAVLRPGESGPGRLRFGADELRMIALTVILFLLVFMAMVVIALVTSTAGAAAGPVTGLFMAGGAVFAVWVGIRLSLAAPMTFVTGELHLFRAWALTRGQFWPLAAAYATALGLGGVVAVAASAIFRALVAVVVTVSGGALDHMDQLAQINLTSMAAFLTPATIAYQLFAAGLQAVVCVVIVAPAAVAYAALARPVSPSTPMWA